MKRKVLSRDRLPLSPIQMILIYAVIWILLDRFNAPGWQMAIFWTSAVFVAIFFLALKIQEQPIDIGEFWENRTFPNPTNQPGRKHAGISKPH